VARKIAERSQVLVKDSLQLVPMALPRSARVLSITYARRAELGAGVAFNGEMHAGYERMRGEFVSADDAAPNFERLLVAADSADVTIVSSYANIGSATATASAPRAFVDFVRRLHARGTKLIVITFGTPYLLQQVPDVSSYLIAWGPSVASQSAAARVLMGAVPIRARLPISIPPLAPLGGGERREKSADK
jgi:beta-N-acetylhexosaminidase